MPLGNTLTNDVMSSLVVPFGKTAADHSGNFATAINNYVQPATYNQDSVVYVSSVPSTSFILPVPNTNLAAATQVANAIEAYWNGTPSPGAPSQGGVVVTSVSIDASMVASTLIPLLTSIYADVGFLNTLSSKSQDISTAVATAIGTVTATHTEQDSQGSTLGPFTMSIV